MQLATISGQVALIIPQLEQLDKWLNTWACSMDERRRLYRAVCTALKEAHRASQAQQYLIKLLRTFNGCDAAALRTVEKEAQAALAYVTLACL